MKRTTILALALGLLVGCAASDALKGTWSGEDSNAVKVSFVFDGKGGLTFTDGVFFDRAPGAYTITGNTVVIVFEGWDSDRTYTFAVNGVNGDTLTMTPPDDTYEGFNLKKK
jgi:hypothetical protein